MTEEYELYVLDNFSNGEPRLAFICGTIEVVQIKVNSIYPRTLIGYVNGGEAYCIDYE